jgi:metal-dependent amidase/aminoacylase/carboxypeptidase family protein
MLSQKIRELNNTPDPSMDRLLPGLEEIYKDIHRNPELSMHEFNTTPSNHSPKFAPVLHPTLKAGLQAMITAAAVWLN